MEASPLWTAVIVVVFVAMPWRLRLKETKETLSSCFETDGLLHRRFDEGYVSTKDTRCLWEGAEATDPSLSTSTFSGDSTCGREHGPLSHRIQTTTSSSTVPGEGCPAKAEAEGGLGVVAGNLLLLLLLEDDDERMLEEEGDASSVKGDDGGSSTRKEDQGGKGARVRLSGRKASIP